MKVTPCQKHSKQVIGALAGCDEFQILVIEDKLLRAQRPWRSRGVITFPIGDRIGTLNWRRAGQTRGAVPRPIIRWEVLTFSPRKLRHNLGEALTDHIIATALVSSAGGLMSYIWTHGEAISTWILKVLQSLRG